jgi:DNA-binding transcriptional LysR family regulator
VFTWFGKGGVKFHQLKAFLAVAATGSIRGAARRLNLSQAALTKALRELEEDLGAPLVLRSVRGVQLTESGARLLVRARLILKQTELAQAEVRQAQGADEGSIAIGVSPLVALTVLPTAVAAFRRAYRKVRLHVVEGLEGIILPGLRDGSLDFGILIVAGGNPGEDLALEPWFSAPNAVVLREGHPLAEARTLAELAHLEWLATSFGAHGLGTRIGKIFAQAGLPAPERLMRVESVIAAFALLRHTDVVSLIPADLLACPETKGIRAVALDLQPARSDFNLIRRADEPLTPAAAAFVACLRARTMERFGPPPGQPI